MLRQLTRRARRSASSRAASAQAASAQVASAQAASTQPAIGLGVVRAPELWLRLGEGVSVGARGLRAGSAGRDAVSAPPPLLDEVKGASRVACAAVRVRMATRARASEVCNVSASVQRREGRARLWPLCIRGGRRLAVGDPRIADC